MIKVSLFQGSEEFGPAAVPLFGVADGYFEKVASTTLLPEVSTYIEHLRPRDDSQYVLVNAMGAGEYYGSNVNGDRFSEAALVHAPADWRGLPVYDKVKSASWAYGFPTFYGAHVFPHHRNKDAKRALGFVELAAWNPHMKRVELVTRLDHDLCMKFGGDGIWDKLKAGMFPDVSMGTKVPFDTCSITLDRELYQKAWSTFDPKKHRSPGDAILEFHKKHKAKDGVGIRGVSITRADYSEYARTRMNFILPDGRKVWVDNDFPKFFDISYVFMGADRIAKAMLKIADAGRIYCFMGSAELAEKLGMTDEEDLEVVLQEKTAANKQATPKSAEINKDVVPNQLAGKAVPLLTSNEPDLPPEVLRALGNSGLESALATSAGLGMVLRPREFQRVTLICLGKGDVADQMDTLGQVFPKVEEQDPMPMSGESFSPVLVQLLAPFMGDRSAFGPIIERRVVVVGGTSPTPGKKSSSHSSELLRKIGSAYNGYRASLMQFVPNAQDLIESSTSPSDVGLRKFASISAEELFTPLSCQYLAGAFMDEVPCGTEQESVKQATASVQRAIPLGDHAVSTNQVYRSMSS